MRLTLGGTADARNLASRGVVDGSVCGRDAAKVDRTLTAYAIEVVGRGTA